MIYIRDIRRMVLMAVILMTAMMVQAQSVTYNHDDAVMNQFTVGEVGAGALGGDDPIAREWYYLLHRNYQNNAMATNKQFFRTQLKLALTPEESHAENLDSALNERKRVEALNIADRTPGVTDVAWQVEKSKIESKLSIYKKNIESLTKEGAPAREYIVWMERYNAINCGLQAVRDAYMPQGKRKEQYIAIYKDILLQNTEVCEYIAYLRSAKEVKRFNDNPRPLPKTQFGLIARTAHGRWKVAMAAGGGGVGTSE